MIYLVKLQYLENNNCLEVYFSIEKMCFMFTSILLDCIKAMSFLKVYFESDFGVRKETQFKRK